jgi:hypothetical protein
VRFLKREIVVRHQVPQHRHHNHDQVKRLGDSVCKHWVLAAEHFVWDLAKEIRLHPEHVPVIFTQLNELGEGLLIELFYLSRTVSLRQLNILDCLSDAGKFILK